jgi:hypothetical protein
VIEGILLKGTNSFAEKPGTDDQEAVGHHDEEK